MLTLQTARLTLVLNSMEQLCRQLEQMSEDDRAEVSPVWLARIQTATESSSWTHGFTAALREGGAQVGGVAFKGPPSEDGVVEIAYGIAPEHQGRGFATEAAQALTDFAFGADCVRVVRAHTKPDNVASARVLTRCGFQNLGKVVDPEDGDVWRWETIRRAVSKTEST